jgi:tetratricopeptide (TPR) repeat protein
MSIRLPHHHNLHPSPLRHDTMPDPPDLFSEATERAELGHLGEALAIFQALLKTDKNNAIIWNNIGIIQFRQGKYRPIKYYRKDISIS